MQATIINSNTTTDELDVLHTAPVSNSGHNEWRNEMHRSIISSLSTEDDRSVSIPSSLAHTIYADSEAEACSTSHGSNRARNEYPRGPYADCPPFLGGEFHSSVTMAHKESTTLPCIEDMYPGMPISPVMVKL
jgi:hypothetical protein